MQKFYLSINVIHLYVVEEDMKMSFNYSYDYIPTTTPHNRRPQIKLEPTSITIHNTSNPSSTARNERSWLTNPSNTRTASYHIVIDEREAIEVIPLNEVAWHAGDGGKEGSGNRTSIGIEICESGNYDVTLSNSVELVAKMLKERKWGVNRLKRHFDWSKKNCPRLMNQDGKWTGWTQFVNRVQAKLNELAGEISATPNTPITTVQPKDKEEPVKTDPPEVTIPKVEEYQMNASDANKVIQFLSAAYNATTNADARKEFNRLANELRKASGQKTM